MLYAKVVLGLPIEGPFDYLVPPEVADMVKPGCRVCVPWRKIKKIGYVIATSHRTSIKKVKPITSLIDEVPVLSATMLRLTRQISEYYCCSWGEAIETALPQGLRLGRRLPAADPCFPKELSLEGTRQETLLIHDLSQSGRWEEYVRHLRIAIQNNRSTIIIFPDNQACIKAREIIISRINASTVVLSRKQAGEITIWSNLRRSQAAIVIGTRSALFAPLSNLGLIIIDAEDDPVYKQDQVPHYHPREVAFMRAKLEKAKLILGSASPSLESMNLVKRSKIRYLRIERDRNTPEVKIVDSRRISLAEKKQKLAVPRYIQDTMATALTAKEKIFLFYNRKGFATTASCISCGVVLKCPRCSINLVYYFKETSLYCRFCSYKMPAPKICPSCNAGYIKFSGMGTEKMESEISRIFPQARVMILDKSDTFNPEDADICIGTQVVLRDRWYDFDLVVVLGIDNILNRVDYRAGEKTFQLLSGLLKLTGKRIVIQTSVATHPCFQAIVNNNPDMYYRSEMFQRKQLGFPPYAHFGMVKVRGRKEARVQEVAQDLFSRFKDMQSPQGVKIIAVNPGQPLRLRGNFYWQVLVGARSATRLTKFLKLHLKEVRHSGIIVTVDVDPL